MSRRAARHAPTSALRHDGRASGRRFAVAWLVLAAGLAPGSRAAEADAQNPAPVNTVVLEAGRRFDRLPGARDESYYSLTYHGALVRRAGTPFKFATALDPDLSAPPEAGGDRNQWLLRYENRAAAIGGSLLAAEGVRPITLAGIEKLDLRGTAAVASNDAGTGIAVGLETAPFRFPGLAGFDVSNWLVLGVNGRRTPAAGGNGGKDHGVATLRAFAGKAFGWRAAASMDVAKTADRLVGEILKQVKTVDEARRLVETINKNVAAGKGMTPAQRVLKDAVEGVPEGANVDWANQLREVAEGAAEAMLEQPTLAVYAESTGWYGRREAGAGRAFRNLFTATLDYWFLPGRDDTFLRVRYEHGYEWSVPVHKRKQWLVSLSVRI